MSDFHVGVSPVNYSDSDSERFPNMVGERNKKLEKNMRKSRKPHKTQSIHSPGFTHLDMAAVDC